MLLRTAGTDPHVMEQKFQTLGLSMWSLALHGTFMDAISDLLEAMRELEQFEGFCLSSM